MPQSVGVQISAPVLKLAVFVQHGGQPSHFARTLLTVMQKKIHHFKCKRSEKAAAITMSTDCNLQISLLDEPICFLEILILLMCRF